MICTIIMENTSIPIAEPIMLRDIKNMIHHNKSYFRRNGIYLVENRGTLGEPHVSIPTYYDRESQTYLTNYYTVQDLIRDYDEARMRSQSDETSTCCCTRIAVRNINYCTALSCISILVVFIIFMIIIVIIEGV